MKRFNTEQEHINFLKPILSRYRIYIQKYEHMTRLDVLHKISNMLNTPIEDIHTNKLNSLSDITTIINVYKNWKYSLCGCKSIKPGINVRQSAIKQRGERKMKVVELFNSIDGEGRRAGELATFIRLFGCNISCVYCDSQYSCVAEEQGKLPFTEMSITQIVDKCKQLGSKNITLTGGEPLIHEDVKYLIMALSEEGFDVNIETNGAVDLASYYKEGNLNNNEIVNIPKYKNVWYTIDYKCPASGMEDKMILSNFDVRHYKYTNTVYKFVVGSKQDLDVAKRIIQGYILTDENLGNYIYLSPVFGDIEPKDIVKYMQDNSLQNDLTPIRIQLQIHKFIYPPDMRGV